MNLAGFSIGDLALPALFVVWVIMMRFVLPRRGVPT